MCVSALMILFDPETEFQEVMTSVTTDLCSSGEEEDSNSLLFEPKNKRDHQLGTTDAFKLYKAEEASPWWNQNHENRRLGEGLF